MEDGSSGYVGASEVDRPVVSVTSVYFCPEGERIRPSTASANFHLAADTTFFDILQGACSYFGRNIADMVLRNANGSIWPMRDRVSNALRHGGQIRLTPSDRGDDEEEVEEVVVVEEVEKDDVDDGRVVAARPPLYRELFLHIFFLTILMSDTYMVETKPVYHTHRALENAFIFPRNSRQPLMMGSNQQAVDNFEDIHNPNHMCSWLRERLIDGLFRTDLQDGWGDIEVFNRIAGGVTIQTSFQEWQNSSTAKLARSQHAPFVGGFQPISTWSFRMGPTQIALFRDNPNQREESVAVIFGQQLEQLTRGVCTFSPEGADEQRQVMRSLQVTMLINNHNYDLFFLGTFRFDMKLSGQVRPYYSFRPFKLEPPWGSWKFETEQSQINVYLRVRAYMALVNFVLVLMRSLNEINACRKVYSDTGSIRPYFSGVFTLLELFNLTCNYVGFGFRIYEQFLGQRTNLESLILEGRPQDIIETDVNMIAVIAGIIVTARALSIISAMLLLFKYLELAPKRFLSSFYLTGTTLGRAGRDLQVVLLLFLVVLGAFSVIGSQMFGSELEFFSSVPSAFFTLCVCVAGSGFIYRPLRDAFPTLGPIFFVVFTLTHLLVITPLFLATLNDAYAVRDEQMRQAAERRAAKEQSRRKERENRLKLLKKT